MISDTNPQGAMVRLPKIVPAINRQTGKKSIKTGHCVRCFHTVRLCLQPRCTYEGKDDLKTKIAFYYVSSQEYIVDFSNIKNISLYLILDIVKC